MFLLVSEVGGGGISDKDPFNCRLSAQNIHIVLDNFTIILVTVFFKMVLNVKTVSILFIFIISIW